MRFDLADLRLFLLVVEAGSITHGAAEAHLSLPAASERLRAMEARSGVRLLERGRRGVAPTEAGEAMAHHARLILRQMAQMQGELGEFARGTRATIRLLANTAAMAEFLPDILAPWLASHPQVDLDLKERQSADIAKAVSAGLAEIGVMSAAVETGALRLVPFATDRLVAVVPRGHALAAARRLAFADIRHFAFVGLAPGSALQEHIDGQAARTGHRLKFRARVSSFDGICRMVAQHAGIGIVPESAARRLHRSLAIAAIRLSDDWATRRLAVCFADDAALSPSARDLVEHIGRAGPG